MNPIIHISNVVEKPTFPMKLILMFIMHHASTAITNALNVEEHIMHAYAAGITQRGNQKYVTIVEVASN